MDCRSFRSLASRVSGRHALVTEEHETDLPQGFLEVQLQSYDCDDQYLRTKVTPSKALRPGLPANLPGGDDHNSTLKYCQAKGEESGITAHVLYELRRVNSELHSSFRIATHTHGVTTIHSHTTPYRGFATSDVEVRKPPDTLEGYPSEVCRVRIHASFFHTPKLPMFLAEQLKAPDEDNTEG